MIKKIVFIIILGACAFAAWFFIMNSRRQPEQEFRANLTDAQKILVTLRRAELAYQEATQGYKIVSASKSSGKMAYSEGWNEMKLPNVEASTGFDYECQPAEGFCQATEIGKMGPAGNGIRIDIESGIYSCLGTYKPVTTEGFDGTLVTVACQA
ncbi:MAG: hypothetical protein WCJ71_03445 [Candidatus Omnitrophota bacterium]